jgi:hypothetical protein
MVIGAGANDPAGQSRDTWSSHPTSSAVQRDLSTTDQESNAVASKVSPRDAADFVGGLPDGYSQAIVAPN